MVDLPLRPGSGGAGDLEFDPLGTGPIGGAAGERLPHPVRPAHRKNLSERLGSVKVGGNAAPNRYQPEVTVQPALGGACHAGKRRPGRGFILVSPDEKKRGNEPIPIALSGEPLNYRISPDWGVIWRGFRTAYIRKISGLSYTLNTVLIKV